MSFIKKNKFSYLIAFLAVSFLSVFSFLMYANIASNADLGVAGDAVKYIEMSKHTFANVDNPFALRILSPLLAKTFIPIFNNGINFPWMFLTILASILSLMIFFHILFKHFRLTFFNSMIFSVALAYTYSYTLFNYADFWLVDPLNNLFFMLGIYFLIEKRYLLFLAVVLIGSTNKEIILFLLPLYPLRVFFDVKRLKDQHFIGAAVSLLVVLALYILFRGLASHYINSGIKYSIFNETEGRSFLENILFNLSNVKNQLYIYTVFDFFWVFFIYSLYLVYKMFGVRNWYFISSIYIFSVLFLSRFFATDVERIFVTMAPFVFMLTAILFAGRNSSEDKKWLLAIVFIYIASNLNWMSADYFVISNIAVLVVFATAFKDIDGSFFNNEKIREKLS